jgi:HAD superfamily hydrolase (TIGR01549 family)
MQGTVGLMRSNVTRAVVGMATTAGSSQSRRPLKGVVFDMDGTLTVPCIDFRLMYRKVLGDNHPGVVSNSPIDILHEISGWSAEEQVQAYGIITEIEKGAHEKLQVMPGAREVCSFLDAHRIPRGLITRNVKDSVDFFHSRFGLPPFRPALSREFTPYKPSPAPLLHICHVWGVSPSEVLMVGDSAPDDIVCGNRAGALTCLLDEAERYHELPEEQQPTHRIHSLLELNSLLQSYDLQFADTAFPSQSQD